MSENFETVSAEATVFASIVLTKEEKIARVVEQIKKLQVKLYNLENDIVEVKAPKVVPLPEVGTEVLFTYGRTTPTTSPQQRVGKVVAVKPASVGETGKKLPAQIKVTYGEGFEQEFAVIYPAQIVDVVGAVAVEAEQA